MITEITNILKKIKKRGGGLSTGFVIGNTSDRFVDRRFYETPIRETEGLIYGGVVVRDVATAARAARIVDGKVDYIFIDDEKKIRKEFYGPNDVGNIEQEVRKLTKKSILLTYKGNDLAVDAIDGFIGNKMHNIGGLKIAIIGLGNLGSKIALRLVERGAYVTGYRRNKKKLKSIISGLNCIKSENTLADAVVAKSIFQACENADIIIGVTNEKHVIEEKHLKFAKNSAMLIDVGKGCFSNEIVNNSSYLVYRLDVAITQKYNFTALVNLDSFYQKNLGRKSIQELGVTLVSAGLAARKGEFVVDDIHLTSNIIGLADNNGSLRKNTMIVQKKIKSLKKNLKIK